MPPCQYQVTYKGGVFQICLSQKVNIIVSKGKTKRFKGRIGKRKNEKKAIISLEKGQKIDITTGI